MTEVNAETRWRDYVGETSKEFVLGFLRNLGGKMISACRSAGASHGEGLPHE